MYQLEVRDLGRPNDSAPKIYEKPKGQNMKKLLLSSALTLGIITSATSQESLGKHEHGGASLELVKIGGAMEAHFHFTSFDMVGFGSPSSEAQEQAVANMLASMQQPDALVSSASCKQSFLKAEYKAQGDQHGHDDHKDEHDEHDHDEHEAGGHADFEVLVALDCSADVAELQINAFALSNSLQHVELEAVIEGEAMTAEIEADAPVLKF